MGCILLCTVGRHSIIREAIVMYKIDIKKQSFIEKEQEF